MVKQKFFRELRSHSNAKIELLERYFVPWLRKITLGPFNNNKCLVIDGFAGEGIYDDGSIGSPIVIIDEAIKYCMQNTKANKELPNITIILIEGDQEGFQKLFGNIDDRYTLIEEENHFTIDGFNSIKLLLFNDTFEHVMTQVVNTRTATLRPSLCFVDPFGFSHTPFHIFEKYLESNKSELLFNFMYEEINRFITHTANSKITQQYEDLFGSDNLNDLRAEVKGQAAPIRKERIINYYAMQLLEKTNSKYVLNFEFKKDGRTKMFLVHATKNIHGLKLMKDVMWKIDETGAFLYDDRKSPEQISFEFFNELTIEEHRKKLSEFIFERFEGLETVKLESIERFVLEETIYPLTNYYKQALTILENSQLIQVKRLKNAKKGFAEDKIAYISFS